MKEKVPGTIRPVIGTPRNIDGPACRYMDGTGYSASTQDDRTDGWEYNRIE